MLHKFKHLLLCLFQDLFQGFVFQIAGVGCLLIDLDEPAQDRLILDDLRVIFDICGCLCAREKFPDIFHAADLRRDVLFLQMLLQGDQVHRAPFLEKLYHSVKEYPVRCLVEIIACEHLRGHHHSILIHKHRPQHCLLCLNAVGRYPFHCRFDILHEESLLNDPFCEFPFTPLPSRTLSALPSLPGGA